MRKAATPNHLQSKDHQREGPEASSKTHVWKNKNHEQDQQSEQP